LFQLETSSGSLGAGSVELGLEVIESSWVVLDGLALVDEVSEVLHFVGGWLTASLSVELDQILVAVEVLNLWPLLVLDILEELWEELLESLVRGESVVKFVHQSLLVLLGWISGDLGVEVVKVDISDIDGEVVLLSGLGIIPSNLILEEALSESLESGPCILW
jgi:hypothetical protein